MNLRKETKQQKQTKEFFEGFALQWSKSSKDTDLDYYNVIKTRNDYVISVLKKIVKKNPITMDVACGTGDLVIEQLKMGYDAWGMDFATSMIKKAQQHAKKEKLSEKQFFVQSFFDWKPNKKIDLISANGFIPYISENQLEKFLQKSYQYLNNKGILIFESRNRLFNCFSYNNYTLKEIQIREISKLLEECVIFNQSKNITEILKSKYKSKIKLNLEKQDIIDNKYGKVLVDKMYQYTPFQLINLLRKNGFKILDLHPNHIHGLTTGAKKSNPKIHKQISEFMLKQTKLHMNLIPLTSSFTITAKKQ
jgi:2-polyprenyl-3-methyl-5-hydroxy-6-metoxy-1,4-benzoquinol methylase